ncbi:MAG TPA: hypothetical protein PKK24_09350, partial [Anaerolineaceae bacterium]|nr:hypothetical protein [Anaerolineaceae bacterium]
GAGRACGSQHGGGMLRAGRHIRWAAVDGWLETGAGREVIPACFLTWAGWREGVDRSNNFA